MRYSAYKYFSQLHSYFLSQNCDSLHLYNKSFNDLIVLKEDYKIRFRKMKEVLKMSEKQMKILGWVATFMSVMMYVSYPRRPSGLPDRFRPWIQN